MMNFVELPKTPQSIRRLSFLFRVLHLSMLLMIASGCFADTATGHVVDPSGNPIAGATVYVIDWQNADHPVKTTTGNSGEFNAEIKLQPVYQGESGCIVAAKGFAPTGGTLFLNQDNRFVLQVPAQVTGSVLDAKGQPVPGAVVSATYAVIVESATNDLKVERAVPLGYGPLKGEYDVKTDAKGAFTIPNLPADSIITIDLHDPNYVTQSATTKKGASTLPAFTALPDVPITGRVLNKDGTPAVGVSVQAHDNTVTTKWIGSEDETAPDGTFKITGLGPGKYSVSVISRNNYSTSSDWIPPTPVYITTTLGTPGAVPDLKLSSGGIVNGMVEDADTHEPVPDTYLSIQTPQVSGQYPINTAVKTDSQGHFTAHIYPGTNSVYISRAPGDYVADNSQSPPSFTIVDGQTLTIDPITIKKGFSVNGVIVDDAGKSVPNISLNIEKAKVNDSWMNFQPQMTDGNGGFVIHQLAAGSYIFDPGVDWTVVSPQSFTVPSTGPVSVVLKKVVGAPLPGVVTDPSGSPIPDVAVTYETLHALPNGMNMGTNVVETTGADGTFTIPNAPTDLNNIQRSTITKDGYMLQSGGDITKTGDHLTISPIVMVKLGGSVEGLVKNGLDKPVAGAWVLCTEAGGTFMPIQTDATGHFKLTGLAIGQVDIYAAKGAYYADKQVDATASPSSTTVTLAPAPTQPPTPDLSSAIELIRQSQGTMSTGNPYFVRDQTGKQIAMLDRDQGVKFIAATTIMNNADFGIMLGPLVNDEPSTALWALPIIKSLPDYGGGTGRNELTLGLADAPYDLKTAKTLFDMAVSYEKLDQITDQNIDDAMQITALAYAVGSPKADGFYRKTMAAMADIIKNAPVSNGYSIGDWLPGDMAQTLAMGSLPKAEVLLATLTPNQRYNTIPQIVRELAKPYPEKAIAAFHLLDNEKDSSLGPWAYNQAELVVLPIIYKTDPAQAMKIARGVADPGQQAQGLTRLADLMPIAQATPLYEEAETKAVDQMNQDYSSACIAAHAWERDKILGAKLFKQAYDKVISEPTPNQFGQGPGYSDFAFYYSRFDPAFSRLLIEKDYAVDNTNQSPYNTRSVIGDVAAMTAIDVQRASAMEFGIKDPSMRYDAAAKVVQYTIASQQVRNTIPFSRWITGEDIDPRAPTGW